MNVDAQDRVHALQLVFMRLKPDGSLDPSDQYTSPWNGVRSNRPPELLGGTGESVVGICYRGHAGMVIAIGLVVRGP